MEYGYSIIMGIFSAALLIYAGLMALTKDYKMIPYRSRQSVKPGDPKKYMTGMAKVVALVSLSPALSSLAGLWTIIFAVIVLIASMVVFIWLGTIIMKTINQKN